MRNGKLELWLLPITAAQVCAIWTSPRSKLIADIARDANVSVLEVVCAQNMCRGMSDRGAAAWINELTSRFQTSTACRLHTEARHPRRARMRYVSALEKAS